MPAAVAALARRFPVEDDEVDPLIIEQVTNSWLGGENGIDELRRALDDHGEAARWPPCHGIFN